jgi:hypothetical protein
MKRTVDFQLCEEADSPVIKPELTANIKFDGRRVAVIKEGDQVHLWGRDNIVESSFPEVIEAFKKIPGNFVVDTEFVVFTDDLKTDRGLLQTRDKTKDKFKIKLLSNLHPASAVILDVLEFGSQDLRNEEYQKRKEALNEHFSQFMSPQIQIAKDMDPQEAWKLANERKLEGIVEKDIHSKYVGKRSDTWIKVKRKEIITLKAVSYEVSNAGITLISDRGDRVACHGQQHKPVRAAIDKDGYALFEARRMAGDTIHGKSREIVFWRWLENGRPMDNVATEGDTSAGLRNSNPQREEQQDSPAIQPAVPEAQGGGQGTESPEGKDSTPQPDNLCN